MNEGVNTNFKNTKSWKHYTNVLTYLLIKICYHTYSASGTKFETFFTILNVHIVHKKTFVPTCKCEVYFCIHGIQNTHESFM